MDFARVDSGALPAAVHASRFRGAGGVEEFHLTVRPTREGDITSQLDWIERAYRLALDALGLEEDTAVLRRFFASDLPNQAPALRACTLSSPSDDQQPCAISWVGQTPVPAARVALWAYHIRDVDGALVKARQNGTLAVRRGELDHLWTTGLTSPAGSGAYEQTRGVFSTYDAILAARGLSLAANVLRTWIFVQDIDANYREMVAARREHFAARGLTPDTHFIASSGIEGRAPDVAATVAMDAYAIAGVRPEQIAHLQAPDHLGPTATYGVTFERATAVAYSDRTHVILSGTASIDPEGRILHPGDVAAQLDRTLENMTALLARATATLADVASFVVYVRDPADHALAWRRMRELVGDAPVQVVAAGVCRPGWLIEVEGTAVVPASNPRLPPF